MKVNKNYLFKVISEVLLEAEEDHSKIMSLIQDGDEESINQAAELYEMGAFDLSEEELEDIMKFFKANEFLGAIIKFKLADKNISVDVRDLSRYGKIKLDQRLWDDSFELTGDIVAAQQALADMGMEMAVVGDFLYVGEKARKLANFREGIKTHLGVAIPNDVDIRLDVWGGRGARMEFPSGLSITWEAIEDEYAEDSDEEDYFMEIMMPNKIGYMVKHTSGQGIIIVKQDESSGDFEEEVIANGVSIEGMKRKIHELTNIDLDAMSALDSNALLESDDDSSSDKNFEKLMDIVDGGGELQALEMYDYFDLSEEQIRALYTKILYSTITSNLEDLPEIIEMRPEVFSEEDMQKPLDWATKKIFKSKMQSPELLLKAIGFDFHNEFTQVYGVTPPRDKEFSIQPEGIDWGSGDDMFLAVPYKGGIVIYGFWFEGTNENNPSDPYIQMKNSSGEKGWIEYDSLHGGLKFETEDTEADVEDVPATIQKFMDVAANEGKRKLNKSYLIESILEVMMEDDELSPKSDFEKLMSALTSDLSNARQAMEMYDLGAYELTSEEDAKVKKAMMDIEAREIVRDSLKGGKDLKALGYDFHQVFMDAYGFTPPKSKEFELWGGKTKDEELSLKATVGGKELEFEFWYDQQFSNYIIEPWFRFDTMHDKDGDVSLLGDHIIIGEDDVEGKVSKEELPGALRSAMGIPWNADVPEWPELPKGQPPVDGPEGTDEPVYEGKRKLNKSYLLGTIAEVASEIGENFGGTPEGGMDQESQKILRELLQLNEDLDESQYYYDAQDLDTDHAEQAIELGQSLGDEDDRDRSAQIDKYVSLKVKKVLKDAIKTETMNAISMLVAEAADNIGLWSDPNNDEEYVSKTVNELSSLYERALLRPLEAVKEFDGSQESLNKWLDAMESAENNLKAAEPTDPAIKVMETIIPKYFLISDHYVTGAGIDWRGVEHTDRKDVKPRTAVKEAEEFFRPAIMKTIMGIQKRMVGDAELDRAKIVLGLNENEGALESEEKEHLIQLLSGNEEEMRQGLALADMLVPDLMDKVNEMDENDQLPRIFLKLFKEEVQKELDKYYKGRTWPSAKQDYDIAKHITREDSDLWTVDTVPDDNWDLYGKTIPELFNMLQFKYNRWTWGKIHAAVDIIVKRFDEIDKAGLSTYFYGVAGDSITGVLEKAFKDRSILGPYIEKWKAAELVKLIK